MHRPEMWGYVQFSTAIPGQGVFQPDVAGPAKHLLHRIYYAQRLYRDQHKKYAATLADLGLAELSHESLASPLRLEAHGDGYHALAEIKLKDGSRKTCALREDSFVDSPR